MSVYHWCFYLIKIISERLNVVFTLCISISWESLIDWLAASLSIIYTYILQPSTFSCFNELLSYTSLFHLFWCPILVRDLWWLILMLPSKSSHIFSISIFYIYIIYSSCQLYAFDHGMQSTERTRGIKNGTRDFDLASKVKNQRRKISCKHWTYFDDFKFKFLL